MGVLTRTILPCAPGPDGLREPAQDGAFDLEPPYDGLRMPNVESVGADVNGQTCWGAGPEKHGRR
ncbi:hypothetical protein GCM10009795_018790 [Nocardioides hankookensis]